MLLQPPSAPRVLSFNDKYAITPRPGAKEREREGGREKERDRERERERERLEGQEQQAAGGAAQIVLCQPRYPAGR